jgi:hypothetical protein
MSLNGSRLEEYLGNHPDESGPCSLQLSPLMIMRCCKLRYEDLLRLSTEKPTYVATQHRLGIATEVVLADVLIQDCSSAKQLDSSGLPAVSEVCNLLAPGHGCSQAMLI